MTVMYDLPHGELKDHATRQDRREMAEGWHRQIGGFAEGYGVTVERVVQNNRIVGVMATGLRPRRSGSRSVRRRR